MKKKIEIIAEIAQGFEGNIKLTELLTIGAISSNADAIKFQLVYADELATPDYQHYKLFKSLEMTETYWREICDLIHKNGKKVYFDVFGLYSLKIAEQINADGIKLSTTEFYNNQLFEASLSRFENIFLSVGGIEIEDIENKLLGLKSNLVKKICLIYGFQSEPTPLDKNNLLKLRILRKKFPEYKIGFMDHSDGGHEDAFHLPLVSLGVGIDAIEKHITLDRNLQIEDFVSGLSPSNFSKFVKLIRRFEPTLGEESFELSPDEYSYKAKATKSVVALRNIKSGEVLDSQNVALKRSASELTSDSILEIEMAIGKILKEDVKIHNPVLNFYL